MAELRRDYPGSPAESDDHRVLGPLERSFVHDWDKEYEVLLARRPDKDQLEAWRRGVVREDGYKTAPPEIGFQSAQGKGAGFV
jgi:16S rRNA uridine-516 pseudouridylate synthase and related pseudouridylate synthases